MAQAVELKPNKSAFLLYPVSILFIITLAILLAIIALNILPLDQYLIPMLVIFILINGLNYYSRSVQYRKEHYQFFDDKIITKGGGIFSEKSTELVIRNITHVTHVKPFIENKLFGTGKIIVELAGSAVPEAIIYSMDDSPKIYELVTNIMKANGFRLEKKELIQKEKPNLIGVFFETMRFFIGSVIGIIFVGFYIGMGAISFLAQSGQSPAIFALAVLIVIGILLWVFGRSVLHFLDLRARVYNIYNDTIVYYEGFLTKVDSFIPIENLADSELTQTLVDKIFSLYDVRISCQGAGQEILFKNISNGKQMEKNIDSLINKSTSLITTAGKIKPAGKMAIAQAPALQRTDKTAFTGNYKMNLVRAFAGPALYVSVLFIPLSIWFWPMVFVYGIILGLFFLIFLIITSATNYSVNEGSMGQKFNFLQQRNIEFSNDKITGIVFHENFVDSFFKTFSIRFWSIGASHDINFATINKSQELKENVLAKFGMNEPEPLRTIQSAFSVGNFFRAHIGGAIFLILVLIGLIYVGLTFDVIYWGVAVFLVLLIAVALIYLNFLYKTSVLKLYKNYAYYKKGIFFRNYYYAPYDRIKDIHTVKYPFSDFGSIKFNVAGEVMFGAAQSRQPVFMGFSKANKGAVISHSFTISYAPGISLQDDLIDLIFYGRPDSAELDRVESNISQYTGKDILTTKPMIGNPLLPTAIFLLISSGIALTILMGLDPVNALLWLLVVIVIDALIIGLIAWSVRVKSYSIQQFRLIAKSGILYKQQISIIFNKIDHLRTSEQILNKIFRNGNIIVHTTGSSAPELIIGDIPNYKEFYQQLEANYK